MPRHDHDPEKNFAELMRLAGDYRRAAANLQMELERRNRAITKGKLNHDSESLDAARRLERRLRGREIRKGRRKPPEAGLAVPAAPPKGPLPKQGGGEAPLKFDS